MSFSSVCILGSGPSGIGIAIACASEGYPVRLVGAAHGDRVAVHALHHRLSGRIAVHAYGHDASVPMYDALRQRIEISKAGTAAADASIEDSDLVIDATHLRLRARRAMLATLESNLSSGAVLATQASPDELLELAQGLRRPDQFVGMRFVGRGHGDWVQLAVLPDTAPGVQAACRSFVSSLRRSITERESVPPPVSYREWLTDARTAPEAAE